MKHENKDIKIDTNIMKIGLSQVLIRPVGGVAGSYGIYQHRFQVVKILKKDLIFNQIDL